MVVSALAGLCNSAGAQCVGALCRNCLGQQLAKINVPTAVAMLTREFHLTLAPQVRVHPDCLLWLRTLHCMHAHGSRRQSSLQSPRQF